MRYVKYMAYGIMGSFNYWQRWVGSIFFCIFFSCHNYCICSILGMNCMRYWHVLKSVESRAIYTIEVEFNLAWSKWLNSFGGLFQTYHAISPLAHDLPSNCLMGIYILWSRLIVSDYPMGCFWRTIMPPMVTGFLVYKFVILSKWFMTHCIFHYISPLWLFCQPGL